MRKAILIILPTLIMILVLGCSNNKKLSGTTGGSEMLYANQWNLVELNGTAVSSRNAHLLFYPGQVNRVSGNAGCNRINGTFELSGVNFIKFSPLATTRMACEPAVRENEFTEALGQVNNWSILNNQLMLSNGRILLAKLEAVKAESSQQ